MSGLDILYQVRRFADLDEICIDGWIFRLHYWVTSTALFSASMMAFAKQYFGDPIECIFDAKNGAEIKAVDAYCWLHSTVHLDTSLMRKLNTLPKIRNPCQGYPSAEFDVDTLYYQWVPFFLFFQAMVFRMPYNLWRSLEGGKMSEFGLMAKRHLVTNEDSHGDDVARQYAILFRSVLHRNNVYFWQFFFCEILNVFVVVGMCFVTNAFLNGRFLGYGKKVWDFYRTDPEARHHRVNPMCSLFPTVTSCQFPSGALTGNLNVDHAMCILSLNIINDKIFLIEWFWFITLSVVSFVGAVFTLLTIACPSFRRVVIRLRLRNFTAQDVNLTNDLLSRCYIGDWFLLHLLAKNTSTYMFRRIIKSLAENVRPPSVDGDHSRGSSRPQTRRHSRLGSAVSAPTGAGTGGNSRLLTAATISLDDIVESADGKNNFGGVCQHEQEVGNNSKSTAAPPPSNSRTAAPSIPPPTYDSAAAAAPASSNNDLARSTAPSSTDIGGDAASETRSRSSERGAASKNRGKSYTWWEDEHEHQM